MSDITNEQRKEIKAAIEMQAAQFTDFATLIWETLGLSEPVDIQLKEPEL